MVKLIILVAYTVFAAVPTEQPVGRNVLFVVSIGEIKKVKT